MGEGHPEQPDRLRVIDPAMEREVFQMVARDVAPRAEISAIARVHPLEYIEAIRAATPTQGHTAIDDETSMSPGSFEAALRSAGGAIFAVDEVMTRKARALRRKDWLSVRRHLGQLPRRACWIDDRTNAKSRP